jgi:hypothetical protein
MSTGHGGLACEACHGSPHAEWPAITTNDNITPIQLQGHTGPIIECRTCHKQPPSLGLGGPHGLHPVNDLRWMKTHGTVSALNQKACKACHGTDLEGTILSRAAAKRELPKPDGSEITIEAGTPVACSLCH